MTLGERHDPTPSYWFEVDIAPGSWMVARTVSGLAETIETEKIREGGLTQSFHELPGRRTWPHRVLKGAIVNDLELFAWFTSVRPEMVTPARRNISISLKGSDGKTVANWNVIGAYPVNYSGPTLDANASQQSVAFEQVELAHMGMIRDT